MCHILLLCAFLLLQILKREKNFILIFGTTSGTLVKRVVLYVDVRTQFVCIINQLTSYTWQRKGDIRNARKGKSNDIWKGFAGHTCTHHLRLLVVVNGRRLVLVSFKSLNPSYPPHNQTHHHFPQHLSHHISHLHLEIEYRSSLDMGQKYRLQFDSILWLEVEDIRFPERARQVHRIPVSIEATKAERLF